MPVRTQEAISAFESSLAAVGRPERAAGEKRYLKSDLHFLGATLPDTRKTVKLWLREHPDLGRTELLGLVRALWRRPVHELRMAAIELLDARSDLLRPEDLELVEWMLRRSGTWAYVDPLAGKVAGGLVDRHPELVSTLDRWSVDEDFWIRRSAMLALLLQLRRGEGDWDRFSGYADAMLEEKEFFIRKAIGWVLREVSKKRPDRVAEWVSARAGRISGVSLREAVKYLPESERERIAHEYKNR